ncbi:hypothetical protein A2U01_0041157, partial [Trifolium medium]|nr:hypothetical protein [Trifolium medium]
DVDISFSLGRVCVGMIERLGVSTESSNERDIDGFEISGGEGYASPRYLETLWKLLEEELLDRVFDVGTSPRLVK